MFGQVFDASDFGTIGFLVLLEGLLSADNALVLAILVRHLPKPLQRKALLYGLGGAWVLRTAAILLAAVIIGFWWLQLLGALYLIYLPVQHFWHTASHDETKPRRQMGFWATVVYLNLVDTAFALDSVVVAVAVVDTVNHPGKLWVVIAGAMIGILILRFAAGFFIRLLERYPVLDHVAYLLVGWAGVKLLLISGHTFVTWYEKRYAPLSFTVPEMPSWLFWAGMALICVLGGCLAIRSGPRVDPAAHAETEEALEVLEETDEAKAAEG
jgi:YkoY family integral membrane protein